MSFTDKFKKAAIIAAAGGALIGAEIKNNEKKPAEKPEPRVEQIQDDAKMTDEQCIATYGMDKDHLEHQLLGKPDEYKPVYLEYLKQVELCKKSDREGHLTEGECQFLYGCSLKKLSEELKGVPPEEVQDEKDTLHFFNSVRRFTFEIVDDGKEGKLKRKEWCDKIKKIAIEHGESPEKIDSMINKAKTAEQPDKKVEFTRRNARSGR